MFEAYNYKEVGKQIMIAIRRAGFRIVLPVVLKPTLDGFGLQQLAVAIIGKARMAGKQR